MDGSLCQLQSIVFSLQYVCNAKFLGLGFTTYYCRFYTIYCVPNPHCNGQVLSRSRARAEQFVPWATQLLVVSCSCPSKQRPVQKPVEIFGGYAVCEAVFGRLCNFFVISAGVKAKYISSLLKRTEEDSITAHSWLRAGTVAACNYIPCCKSSIARCQYVLPAGIAPTRY